MILKRSPVRLKKIAQKQYKYGRVYPKDKSGCENIVKIL